MAAAGTLKDFPQKGLELSTSSDRSYGFVATIAEDSVRDLKRFYEREGGKRLRLSSGASPALHYGQKQISLRFPKERAIHEVFAARSGRQLSLVATVKYRAVSVDANAQDSAERDLAEKLAAIKEQKERLTTKTISDAELKSLRKDRNGRTYIRSPAMTALKSGPTPSSPSLNSTVKVNPRLQAIRTVLLHLLALKPDTLVSLCEKVRCSREDCKSVLDKIALLEKGRYELTRNSYKQLDVWQFRYPSAEARETAIDNAIHAYKRLRLPNDDPHWQSLLPEKERGKGKVPELSAKPQPDDLFGEEPAPAQTSEDLDFREKQNAEHARRMAAKAKATKQILGGKKTKPAPPSSPAPPPRTKVTKSKPAKPSKAPEPETKYKSAEYISDSDVEMSDRPAKTTPEKKAKPEPKPAPRKTEKPRPAASTAHKHESKSSRSDGRQQSPHKRSPVGSPPHKRSPLGTSPPLNASDLEYERVVAAAPKAKSSAAQSAEYKSLKRKHDDDRVEDKKRHHSDDEKPRKRADEPERKKHQHKSSIASVSSVQRKAVPDYKRIAELEETISLRNQWQQDYKVYQNLYEEVAAAQRSGGHVDEKKYARVTKMQVDLEEGKRRIAGMVGACG